MTTSSFGAALEALGRPGASTEELCLPFVDLFPVSGASVATVGDLLGSETLSASDEQAARLDELQFDLGEGPCWDAMAARRPILEPDVRHAPRTTWPAFSAAIREDDIGSIFAFPLLVGPLRIGAIDLYSVAPVDLDREQTRQADAMAEIVGRQVLRRALGGAGRHPEAAGNAYSRRLVHQATGMVLAQLDLSADDARLVIQGYAFASSRSMMEVARDVIDGDLNFAVEDERIEASR